MGDNKEVSTNEPSNPEVNPTLSRILQGVRSNVDNNPTTQPMTEKGWYSQLSAAQNPAYAAGVNGATADFADAAAGNQYGANDAAYAKLSDNTLRDVNSMFTNSGRFGSGSHVETAVNAMGDVNNANIAADRQWQTQAASALPGLFSAGQAPGQVQQSVGQAQQAQPWYNLGQASSVLSGTANTGGNTMTQPGTPWWQSAAGLGIAGLGAAF
jgi:hypothetical protein